MPITNRPTRRRGSAQSQELPLVPPKDNGFEAIDSRAESEHDESTHHDSESEDIGVTSSSNSESDSSASEMGQSRKGLPVERVQAATIGSRKIFTTKSGLFEAVLDGTWADAGTKVDHFSAGELFLSCSSFYVDLFDEAELRTESADVLCGGAVKRADEEGVVISPLSPLMASLCLQIHRERCELEDKLVARYKETKARIILSGSALEAEAREFVSRGDSLSKDDKQIIKLAMGSRLRRFEALRLNLSAFIENECRNRDLSVIIKETIPLFLPWAHAMISSQTRTLRHTGTFVHGQLAVSLLNLLKETRSIVSRLAEELVKDSEGAKKSVRRKKGEQQLETILRHFNEIVVLLVDEIFPRLVERVQDISWHIQYEAVAWMNVIASQMPVAMLLVEPKVYQGLWLSASSHQNPEVRRLAMVGVQRELETLSAVIIAKNGFSQRDEILDFGSDCEPLKMLQSQAIDGLMDGIGNKIPSPRDPLASMTNLVETFMERSAGFCRNPDIYTAAVAADNLRAIIKFEATVSPMVNFNLSEPCVTGAVSCLVYVDSPILSEPIARAVDAALFATSIIRRDDASMVEVDQAVSSHQTPAASTVRVATNLSKQGVKISVAETNRLVMDVTTVCEFLADYATGQGWQERHQQVIKAFWTLAPIIKHWTFIGEFMCLQLGRRPTEGSTNREVFQSSTLENQVIEDSNAIDFERNLVHPQLTILLGGLEVQRLELGGASRYLDLDQGHRDGISPAFRFRGYRLTTRPALDPLWNLENASPDAIEEMAKRTLPLWRFVLPILDGCRTQPDNLLVALALVYELLDATACLIEQKRVETRHWMNLPLIEAECDRLMVLVMKIIETHADRQVLNAAFAVLHVLRVQYSRISSRIPARQDQTRDAGQADGTQGLTPTNTVPQGASMVEQQGQNLATLAVHDVELGALLEGAKNRRFRIEAWLEDWGSRLIAEVLKNVEDTNRLRTTLNQLVAAGQNSLGNIFRHGLEALDELITIVEKKHQMLNDINPDGPSDSLTLLCLDTVWTALAAWGAQIERRFYGYIKPQISEIIGGTNAESSVNSGPREDPAHNRVHDFKAVLTLAERLKLLKEDLDIFRELSSQLVSFCQACSVGWRLLSQKSSSDVKPEAVKELSDAERMSAVVSAVAATKMIVHIFLISLGNTIWNSIEQHVAKLLDPTLLMDQECLSYVHSLIQLAQECRDPNKADASLEVARLLDHLKVVGREHRSKMEASWTKELLAQVQPLGVGSGPGFWGPSSMPSPTGIVSMLSMFSEAISEEKASAVLDQVYPDLSEVAACLQIDLLATVTQCPDPGLWKDGAVGQVILHGFSSKSVVHHEMAVYFMEHVIEFEAVEWEQEQKLADAGRPTTGVKSTLLEMIIGSIHQSLDRQKNRSAKGSKWIASHCGEVLMKHKFFQKVPPSALSHFAEQALYIVLEETAGLAAIHTVGEGDELSPPELVAQPQKANGLLLTLLANEVIKGKAPKRKDQRKVQEAFEEFYGTVARTLPDGLTQKFLDIVYKFLIRCFPGVTTRNVKPFKATSRGQSRVETASSVSRRDLAQNTDDPEDLMGENITEQI